MIEKEKEDQIMCTMNYWLNLIDDLQSSRSEILFDHSPEPKKYFEEKEIPLHQIKPKWDNRYICIHIKQIAIDRVITKARQSKELSRLNEV